MCECVLSVFDLPILMKIVTLGEELIFLFQMLSPKVGLNSIPLKKKTFHFSSIIKAKVFF